MKKSEAPLLITFLKKKSERSNITINVIDDAFWVRKFGYSSYYNCFNLFIFKGKHQFLPLPIHAH